jgi:hypothetical protein
LEIKKAGHNFVDVFRSAAGIHAAMGHAASLEEPLGWRSWLDEGQDRPPNLEVFEQFSWDLGGGLWLQ